MTATLPASELPAKLAKQMSESDLQERVCKLLDALGYRWQHQRPAMSAKGWRTPIQGSPGFPDIVAVKPPRLLFIELKSERGQLTAEQDAWKFLIQQCERSFSDCEECDYCQVTVLPEWFTWKPSHLLSGAIERILR